MSGVRAQPNKRGRNPAYAELQVTSNFSFLRSGSHPDELVAQAKALGLQAIALTDRNTLAGVVRAHVAARDVGLRFIVGVRLDLADGPSLLCYPRDRAAYGRLCRLLTLGQMRAEKGDCILHLEDVKAHAEGQVFIVLPPEDWAWRAAARRCEGWPVETGDGVCAGGAAVPVAWASHARASVERDMEALGRVIAFPGTVGVAELTAHDMRDETCLAASPATGPASPPSATSPASATSPTSPASTYLPSPVSSQKVSAAEKPVRSAPLASMPFDRALPQIGQALRDGGADAIYLGAHFHYRGDDHLRLRVLDSLSASSGLPLVACGDVLYHAPHRKALHDVLTCVRHGVRIDAAGHLIRANAECHVKSAVRMAQLFAGYEACLARTLEIVEACHFSLDELVYEYPDEPVPEGVTPQEHLKALTWQGAKWRYPAGIPEKVRHTLQRELKLISKLDYAPYFLTVHDIVSFARSQGILAQGRGSAANSAVCFCLGITAVDPADSDLLFERFISEERREPPDIDVDFEHERREEVIQYIYARYGREKAGLTATVISYKARSAVRDVGKAMGLSEDTISALAGMVWGTRGGGVLPDKHVREAGLDPSDPYLGVVLELTNDLIGFPRHLSQHVGGFVLTRGPLSEVVPIGNARMDGRTTIEWDKDDIAALGLLKIDVLALGMLTCIHRAFDLMEAHHDRPMSLASVPREDAATYEMLCRADSIGVFQVESRAQMNMLPRLKPRTFYDLVIEVAIVRPGPIQGDMVHPYLRRRSGLEAEVYPSPSPEHGPADELQQILGRTKGVPLFQEQAMRIAMVAAKFSDAKVNELRKAMATFRKRGTIGLLQDKMINAMAKRGYDKAFAERCFNQIKGFGEYGFPESHAASFAHLVYVSAWIKCHYPDVFCCALLNSQPMGFYAPAQIVRDAREHGVEVRPVDVSHSDWDCTLEDAGPGRRPAVRLGLRQVDGIGEEAGRAIVAAREALRAQRKGEGQWRDGQRDGCLARAEEDAGEGVFRDVREIQLRAGVKRSVLERLAAADAFGEMGLDRRQALWAVRGLVAGETLPLFAWCDARDDGKEGRVSLPAMALSEHVVQDYQTLKMSLKAHPVSFLRERLFREKCVSCNELGGLRDGAFVTIAGVVLVRQRPGSAKGVVFMTIEDESGVANAVIWPKALERFRKVVMGARLVFIKGRIQRHEDIIHVVCSSLEDRSHWLQELSENADLLKPAIARADEVLRPDPGSAGPHARDHHPRWAGHPRNEVIIPKSRDFH